MAKKFHVTGEQRDDIDGRMIEIKRQLRLKSGSPIDPELVKTALQDIVEGRFKSVANSSILRCISSGHILKLKASDGSRIIRDARGTFPSGIYGNFSGLGLNKPGLASPEMIVDVHEVISNAKFMNLFESLPGAWNQKWIPQDKVIEFCETLPDWLHPHGDATFFLTKKDKGKPVDENKPEENLAVIVVQTYVGGPYVIAGSLESDNLWCGEARHRVVAPRLTTLAE